MTRWIFTVVAATIAISAASAAEKQPFTVDDVYRVEQITDYKISPTGDEAVYVRHWYDVNFPGRRTAIWRIDGKTGRREPLEVGEPDGRMPVYSPDGNWLLFISDRETEHDRYLRPRIRVPAYSDRSGILWATARGELRRKDNITEPKWSWDRGILNDGFFGRIAFSHDGKHLLMVASPDSERMWYEDQGEGYEGYEPTQIYLNQVPFNWGPHIAFPGSVGLRTRSSDPPSWQGDAQWSRDQKSVIFHANRTEDQESVRYSINKNYDLWRDYIDKGEVLNEKNPRLKPEQLTSNPGPDVSPRVSPDGKHVLYLSVPRQGPHMDVFNLCVLPLEGEKTEPRVIVNAHDAEREADGTPPFQPTFPLRDDCWIDDVHVRVTGVLGTKTETRVFHIAGPEAAIAAAAKPEPEPHANPHFAKPEANSWLAERHLAPQELVRWKSFDGLEIEGVLTLPPPELAQFKRPYPVIVYPHGGPHGVSAPGFNIVLQVFASAGYAVFQPNYRGSYGYGRKFLDAARFDMGGSDMQDILTGVDKLIAGGVVDAKRQFVYGTSYGGYSACRLVTLTDRFQAVVAQNPVTDLHAMWRLSDLQSWTEWEFGGKPWETVERDGRQIDIGAEMRDRSPTTHAHKVKTPTLLLHADHDRRCPLAMGQMFYRLLKENGCPTELVVYKDERHQLWQVKHQADVLQRTLAWFAAHAN